MNTIVIYEDKELALKYADDIHKWLLKNRKGYNAEQWTNVDFMADKTATKFYVKVPPDYEKLNSKITKPEEKLTIPDKDVTVVDKMPNDWAAEKKDNDNTKPKGENYEMY
jgi:hypothetical protein